MNVPQNDLNSLRVLAGKIKQAGSQAMRAVGREQAERAAEVIGLAAQLETRLEQAGAERPAGRAPVRVVPLEMLDTPANRHYLELLRETHDAGMAVDRERFGPSIGTDGCAQVIEMVLAEVEQEVYGPAGRVRE